MADADELDLDFEGDVAPPAAAPPSAAPATSVAAPAAPASSPRAASPHASSPPQAKAGEFALFVSGMDGDEDIWRGKISSYAALEDADIAISNFAAGSNVKVTFPNASARAKALVELAAKSDLTVVE